APMLFIGEKVGHITNSCEQIDIAVDPLDGTELVASNKDHAISVIAVAPKGKLLHAPDMYMDKLCVGPKAKGSINIDLDLETNIKQVAKALNKPVSDMGIVMLERERHQTLLEICRKLNVRVTLVEAGDISTAIATCFDDSGIDMMVGSGGAPEGVLAAAAIKCLGGDFEGRLLPSNQLEIQRCQTMGLDVSKRLKLEDLIKGNEVQFAATAVTNTNFSEGIVFLNPNTAITNSIAMRSETGTIRYIKTVHYLDRKEEYIQ
ncbi:MAG: class II fructose-bisphosphatase, partial [Bacilli bacterium]